MQGNGPLNRKKKVSGTADESSMQTHQEAQTGGPVGSPDGYQDRKAQSIPGASDRGASGIPQSSPISRPKNVSGQAGGSMNTGNLHSAQSQQHRPVGGGTAQPNPFLGNSGRPQQSASAQKTSQQQSASRPSAGQQQQQRASSAGQPTRAGGKGSMLIILVVAAVLLLGGGGGLSGLFGGGSDSSSSSSSTSTQNSGSLLSGLLGGDTSTSAGTDTSSLVSGLLGADGDSGSSLLSSLFGGYSESSLDSILGGSWFGSQTGYATSSSSAASSSQTSASSVLSNVLSGVLNRSVAEGSRAKYTNILGNGKDKVTLMVYMCGADLESRSAMATKDLQEMINATTGDINLIVFTGGAKTWQNKYISSKCNQIWQISNGKLSCLNDNAGTASMTNPETLASFIKYCAKNFKANRYALILWDHGSGSVSGYGYDERNQSSGSMSLAGLNQAFQNGGVKFDFIGFDTCLMATVENALMASNYADYLIASEETEPGIGWYYTNWLTAWGKNTSMETLDIGKMIIDDFVTQCNTSCRGQQTTLSMIDLAELSNTVPDKLTAFSKSVSSLLANKEYKAVSTARNGTREFASSNKIDQVDLTDLCLNLNTTESNALAKVLKEAVKYNRINNISDAHGLSIYFPYKKVSNVDKAVKTYEAIGMDDSYAQAIRDFAGMEVSGQAATGGASSPMPSLFGGLGASTSSSASSGDMISDLLSAFLGGGYSNVSGLDSSNISFLSGRSLSDAETVEYLTANILDTSKLVFTQQQDGSWMMALSPEQWALVTGVDQNVFYDNGKGYVDLGLDNLFTLDKEGRMTADMDGTWLALNGQVAPYYHETTQYLEDGKWIITGRVPALLNGVRVDLLIVFDSENEDGYVAGARNVYTDETETVAKALDEIQDGDTIQLLADLYDYDQNYTASYEFGNPITVSGAIQVSNVYLPEKTKTLVTYRFTDIYNQAYWTPVIGK